MSRYVDKKGYHLSSFFVIQESYMGNKVDVKVIMFV